MGEGARVCLRQFEVQEKIASPSFVGVAMTLYFMRNPTSESGSGQCFGGPVQEIEVDLAKLFADSEAGKLKSASEYQKICGTRAAEMGVSSFQAHFQLDTISR